MSLADNADRIAVVFLAAFLVGGIVSTVGDVGPLKLSTFPGGTTLCGISFDDVSIDSNDPALQGSSWIVEAVAGCSDHIIEGGAIIDNEDMKAQDPSTGRQAEAQEDFQIGATTVKQWTENDIPEDDDERVFRVTSEEIECTQSIDCSAGSVARSVCDSYQASDDIFYSTDVDASHPDLDVEIVEERTLQADILHCFRAVWDGEIRTPRSTTRTDFENRFTMCADNTCESGTVTKGDSSLTVGSGDHKAHVTWIGSLVSDILDVNLPVSRFKAGCESDPPGGTSCSSPFNVVDSDLTLDKYVDNRDLFKSRAENEISLDGDSDNTVSTLNRQAEDVFDPAQEQSLIDAVGTWIDDVSFNGNELRLNAKESAARQGLLGRASFTVRIDAGWVGLEINVGDPEITPPPNIEVEGGRTARVNVDVANEASVDASIQTSVTCDTPLVSGGSQTRTISAQSSLTYSFTLGTQEPQQDTTVTCDIAAADLDSDETRDTASFNVRLLAGDTPPPPATEDAVPGGCTDGVDNDNDGLVDDQDPDCEGDGIPVEAIIIALVVVIGGLIGLVVTQ